MSRCWGGTVGRAPAPCFQVCLSILLHLQCSNFILLCRFEHARARGSYGRQKLTSSSGPPRQQAILPRPADMTPMPVPSAPPELKRKRPVPGTSVMRVSSLSPPPNKRPNTERPDQPLSNPAEHQSVTPWPPFKYASESLSCCICDTQVLSFFAAFCSLTRPLTSRNRPNPRSPRTSPRNRNRNRNRNPSSATGPSLFQSLFPRGPRPSPRISYLPLRTRPGHPRPRPRAASFLCHWHIPFRNR